MTSVKNDKKAENISKSIDINYHMFYLFIMTIIGAYDKSNNNYVFPQNASKKIKYKCPDCDEDLIFKKQN